MNNYRQGRSDDDDRQHNDASTDDDRAGRRRQGGNVYGADDGAHAGHDTQQRPYQQDARWSEGQMGGQYGGGRAPQRDSRDRWPADSSAGRGDYGGPGRDSRYGSGREHDMRDNGSRPNSWHPSEGSPVPGRFAGGYDDEPNRYSGHRGGAYYQNDRQNDHRSDRQEAQRGPRSDQSAFQGGAGHHGSHEYGGHGGEYGGMDRTSGDPYGRGMHGPSRTDQGFDPDYQQWRNEQMRALDNDYLDWKRDRYQKFSDEFNQWRQSDRRAGSTSNRSGSNASETAMQGSGSGTGRSTLTGSSQSLTGTSQTVNDDSSKSSGSIGSGGTAGSTVGTGPATSAMGAAGATGKTGAGT